MADLIFKTPSLYVIVDLHNNDLIAGAETTQAARRFIRWQGMTNRWGVKLRAEVEKK